MHNGWITLHRKLINSPVFKDPLALKLWVYLLLSANHKEGKHMVGNQVVIIPRGSNLTGRKTLSQATDIQESKVERLLKLFEKCGKVEQQTFTKYRLISITNYDTYQSVEQQVNSKRTASEQQVNTNNNDNNVNKVNKKQKKVIKPAIKRDYPNELNVPAWNEYIDYRKEAKIRKLTMAGEEKQIEKIIRYGGYEVQQQCINETIANGWQGIFEPKKVNGSKSKAGNFLDRCVDGWNDT